MADKEICGDCGKIHVTVWGTVACRGHITGTNKQTPCKRSPIAGHWVCRVHGGALTKTKNAAQERLGLMSAQGQIADLMRECDIPEQHPIDGLLEVVRVAGSMMRLLTIKVGELSEDPNVKDVLVEGSRGELSTKKEASGDAFWGLNAQGEMTPHTYVQLLKLWTERYERACKTALDANIDERLVRNAETTSNNFFTALGKALESADLTPTQQGMLRVALAQELRRLTTGVTEE